MTTASPSSGRLRPAPNSASTSSDAILSPLAIGLTGSAGCVIAAGGNVYFLAKLAGILGLNVQDLGAQQTGMSVDAFKQMLLDQAKTPAAREAICG